VYLHLTVTPARDGRFRNEQVQTVKRPLVLPNFSSGAVFSSRSQEVVQTYTVVSCLNLIPALAYPKDFTSGSR